MNISVAVTMYAMLFSIQSLNLSNFMVGTLVFFSCSSREFCIWGRHGVVRGNCSRCAYSADRFSWCCSQVSFHFLLGVLECESAFGIDFVVDKEHIAGEVDHAGEIGCLVFLAFFKEGHDFSDEDSEKQA